jgi:hypothetical protein
MISDATAAVMARPSATVFIYTPYARSRTKAARNTRKYVTPTPLPALAEPGQVAMTP